MLRPVWRFSKKKIQVFDLVCPHFWTEISHRLLVRSIFVYWFIFLSHTRAPTRTRTRTHTLSLSFSISVSVSLLCRIIGSLLSSHLQHTCALTHTLRLHAHTHNHTHTHLYISYGRDDYLRVTGSSWLVESTKRDIFQKKSTPSSNFKKGTFWSKLRLLGLFVFQQHHIKSENLIWSIFASS